MIYETTQGAEDVDEVVAVDGNCTLHIERMDKNNYMVSFGNKDKQVLLFIGHWPKNPRKQGKLMLNVMENTLNAEIRK